MGTRPVLLPVLTNVAQASQREEINNLDQGYKRKSGEKSEETSAVSQKFGFTVKLVSLRGNELVVLEKYEKLRKVIPGEKFFIGEDFLKEKIFNNTNPLVVLKST